MRRMSLCLVSSLLLLLLACQPTSTPGGHPPPTAPATITTSPAPTSTVRAVAGTPDREAIGGLPAALSPPVAVSVGVLSSISDSGIYIVFA